MNMTNNSDLNIGAEPEFLEFDAGLSESAFFTWYKVVYFLLLQNDLSPKYEEFVYHIHWHSA